MSPRTTQTLLALIGLGLVARAVAWAFSGGFHYPDEIFQQLEPAHYLRTGVAWLPWEFGRGLRSWILPWVYAGLMEALSWVGVTGHAALRAVNLHNSLWTAAMIPAAWRMGRALGAGLEGDPEGQRAATVAAALTALWPTLLHFGPHALMGTPSMVFLTWGWTFWLELRAADDPGQIARKGFWMGFWFGLAGMARFTSGMHMLVPLAELLLMRRWRAFGAVLVGALPGTLALGLVDWITWGRPFHSAIEHFTYNYIEDGASHHGTSPWHTYLSQSLGARLGPAWPLAAALALMSAPRAWPLLLAAAVPTGLLSTIAHKEERFLMHNWPLLTTAMAVGVVRLQRWLQARKPGALAPVTATALTALLLASNLAGSRELPWRWRAGVFQAQDFVGDQPDATGLLLDDRQHLNGGYLALDRVIPQVQATNARASNPLFNYAALTDANPLLPTLRRRGWGEVARFEDTVVLRRPAP